MNLSADPSAFLQIQRWRFLFNDVLVIKTHRSTSDDLVNTLSSLIKLATINSKVSFNLFLLSFRRTMEKRCLRPLDYRVV